MPANLCAKVPAEVGLATASITTIAAIAMHGIRLADVRVGSRVGVIGCGLVGQLALRLLRSAGAQTFALDIDPSRVAQAAKSGADQALIIDDDAGARVHELSAHAGLDEVIVAAAAATSEPLHLATTIARERGTVVLVGAVPIEFARGPLYDKELRFRVSRSYGPGRYDPEYEERGLDYPLGYVRWTEQRNMESVLGLQAQGRVSLDDLVEVVPADSAPDAYARLTGSAEERPKGALVLAYGAEPESPSRNGAGEVENAERNGNAPGIGLEPPSHATKVAVRRARVRVGLIGPGGFASRVLIPALQAAGAELAVVGGGSGPSAAAAVRAGTFSRLASDPSAVIDDPEVDAVVIATRHAAHADLVVAALERGKHVFCEKPMALTAQEHERVIAVEAASEGTLMIGFNRRFSPQLREMRTFLAAGGAPLCATYRISAGQLAADHWTHDLAAGGGRMLGEGCHFVDALAFLTGSPVTTVHATGYGPRTRPIQAYDNVIVSLTFGNSSVGSIVYVADGSRRVGKERVEAFCGDRSAILDDYRKLELLSPASAQTRSAGPQDKGHRREIADFIAGTRAAQAPVSSRELANDSLATLAIIESLRTGRPVPVPPAGSSG